MLYEVITVHPLVADDDVLQRKGQGVPDMQAPGDIRRRHHDGEFLASLLDGFVAVDFEVAALFPNGIKRRLDSYNFV